MLISEAADRKIDILASPMLGNSRLLSFYKITLRTPDQLLFETALHEHALDILSGICDIHVKDDKGKTYNFTGIGGRTDIFSDLPEFVYIPRNSSYRIRALTENFECAVCTVAAAQDSKPAYISKTQVKRLVSGKDNWQREVFIGLGEEGPSTMLFMGEADSPPGNWSGYPPNRHTENAPPIERSFEEMYYMKITPMNGFALGGIYSDYRCRKETSRITMYGDSQVFNVPSGYHFIAPAPGYHLKYIWILGGEAQGFGQWVVDPDYQWLL